MRLAALLLLTACGGGEVALSVHVPGAHADDISDIVVRSFEPPVAAPFTCDDLAYGRVDLAVIPVSTDGELRLRTVDEGSLGSIPRDRPHVFLGEAHDADGELIMIGCEDAEAIDEKTALDLYLEPSVYLVPVEEPQLNGRVGEPIAPIRLIVHDVYDNAAPGIHAEWTTAGPGGSNVTAEADTNAAGELTILPPTIEVAGPFVVDIRVRWADFNPQRATGFRLAEPKTTMIADVADYTTARFGDQDALALMRSERIELCTGPELSCGQPIALPGEFDGRLVRIPENDRDALLLVGESRWLMLRPGEPPVTIDRPSVPLPDRALAAGACPNADEVLFDRGDLASPRYLLYGIDGHPILDRELPDRSAFLLASGCAETAEGELVRTFVLRFEDNEAQAFLLLEQLDEYLEWNVVGDAVAIGSRDRGPLLGTQFDLDDIVISRVRLDVEYDYVDLEPFDADVPPEFPERLALGDIDGDGELDLVSILSTFDGVRDHFLLWAALGARSSGARISGAISIDDVELCSGEVPDLLLIDDGGKDAIVLVEWCGEMLHQIVLAN